MRLSSKIIYSQKKKNSFLFIICLLIVISAFFSAKAFLDAEGSSGTLNRIRYSLDGEWEFRQENHKKWYLATVPGCVHTDLMDNGLIPDPFYRDNEKRLQWIEKENWKYRKEFKADEIPMNKSHVELVCKGLDTFAKIFLNGEKIAETDNMFRGYRFDIKPFLKAGKNEIQVSFDSPVKRAKILKSQLPYELPGGSSHTRKAPYHFGWDWGPRLVTSGIWRPIYIEAWDEARINDFEIIQEFPEKNKAALKLKIAILSDIDEEVRVKVRISGEKTYTKNKSITLQQGLNFQEISFEILNPELWWPAGMGEQNLYKLEILLFKEKQILDSLSNRIGIRTLVLEQKNDQWGKRFQFVVNGIPFFAKGGNWIPADMFLNRVSRQKYEKLLKSCVEANMNMLRVWGGGVYESPEFYELCDELGITIWQDFMFACAMYPGDDAFLRNVQHEAEYVIKELRFNPCIALWCGNNECEEGWFHWGWKNRLPQKVWADYEKIFHQILPQAVKNYDPQRQYWPSSPHSEKTGEPRSEKSGDMHYWGIWHGKEPFKEYQKKFHRFMSEFGFQSFPLLETIKTFTLPEDWNITSPVMEHHQKHPQGNKLILHYMLDHYRLPKNFESILWLSQVLQAEGMKTGVEHFRSQMPRTMGSLYWQINDCWQVASWSGMDYFGRWKALHHYAKRFYNPVLIIPLEKGKHLHVYCISDLLRPVEAEFRSAVYSYGGKVLSQERSQIKIEPGKSLKILSKSLDELKKGFPDEEVYFYCELAQKDKILSSNVYHFSMLKKVSLPPPGIEREISQDGKKIIVSLESKNFAKDVYLSAAGLKGRFSDNFFDMIPRKKYELEFFMYEKIDIEQLKKRLKIITLRDTY